MGHQELSHNASREASDMIKQSDKYSKYSRDQEASSAHRESQWEDTAQHSSQFIGQTKEAKQKEHVRWDASPNETILLGEDGKPRTDKVFLSDDVRGDRYRVLGGVNHEINDLVKRAMGEDYSLITTYNTKNLKNADQHTKDAYNAYNKYLRRAKKVLKAGKELTLESIITEDYSVQREARTEAGSVARSKMSKKELKNLDLFQTNKRKAGGIIPQEQLDASNRYRKLLREAKQTGGSSHEAEPLNPNDALREEAEHWAREQMKERSNYTSKSDHVFQDLVNNYLEANPLISSDSESEPTEDKNAKGYGTSSRLRPRRK